VCPIFSSKFNDTDLRSVSKCSQYLPLQPNRVRFFKFFFINFWWFHKSRGYTRKKHPFFSNTMSKIKNPALSGCRAQFSLQFTGKSEFRRKEFRQRNFDNVEILLEFRNMSTFYCNFDNIIEILKSSKFLRNYDNKVFLLGILLSDYRWNFDNIYSTYIWARSFSKEIHFNEICRYLKALILFFSYLASNLNKIAVTLNYFNSYA
jgi:hypothetical protein